MHTCPHTLICVCLHDVTAPRLGFLFEYYMYSTSGYACNRRWLQAVGTLVGDAALTTLQQDTILAENQISFHGWLLLQINSIGSNGRRQMFYVTFIAKYYGLSREGIDLLAAYGYGVTKDMFDDLRALYKVRSESATRYTVWIVLCYKHISKSSTEDLPKKQLIQLVFCKIFCGRF
jgi:hypothetical protein